MSQHTHPRNEPRNSIANRRRWIRWGALAAGDHDHVLIAQLVAGLGGGAVFLGTEHDLRDALTVTQVHKNHPVVIPHAIHPAGKGHGLTGVGGAEFIAMVSAVHGG